MSTRRIILECVAVAALLPGCKREERSLRVDAPSAQPVYAVRLTDFVPGTQPSTQPTQLEIAAVKNDYESNAYAMSEGQRFYASYNCSGCHANGGGGMGPPLMDDEWLYGSRPEQVYASIIQGRPNGMPAWGGRLPDEQVWKIVAYVRSLSGLARMDAAPPRSDHMETQPPPASIDRQQPKDTKQEQR
jgi:cytochrome c oxidase cbb3-type subunit 3